MNNHFTQGSSQKKSRGYMFLLIGILLVGLLQGFTACDLLGVKSDDSLYGTWKAVGNYVDGYKITYDGVQEKAYIEYLPFNKDQFDDSYRGEIQNNSSKLTGKEGYIIFKVLTKGSFAYQQIGKYHAVHWKDFTGDTVKMSNAYKGGGNDAGMPTAADAATEYTVANGYYTYYGEYQRQ